MPSKHPQVDELLARAWTHCAPSRLSSVPYPTGFWPDVGRIAVEMALGLELSFGPLTSASHGGLEPRPPRARTRKGAGKISAEQKAANTAALLAKLAGGA